MDPAKVYVEDLAEHVWIVWIARHVLAKFQEWVSDIWRAALERF